LKNITLIPLRTPLIKEGDSITEILYNTIRESKVVLDDGDVIVIAETPLAITEGRFSIIEKISPSEKAETLGNKYQMDPRIVEIIIQESDVILGGVEGVLLTIKNDTLIANAGVDFSNAPPGCVVLFPRNPQKSAQSIKNFLEKKFHKKIAVIIGDSRVQPLRRGTIGVAIGVAGMEPVEDFRGKKDLYGRELQITFRAIADDLVSAAQLLMGEGDEQIPAVLIKGAPIKLTDKITSKITISESECLYMNSLLKS